MGAFSFLKTRNDKSKYGLAEFVISSPRYVQIGRESLDLLCKTTNPSTFFGRYDDLVFSLESLEQSTREVTSDTFKSELQIEFIDRLIDADKLHLLVADLVKYRPKMTPDSLEYLEWVSD